MPTPDKPVLEPQVAEIYLFSALTASADVQAFCGNRVAPGSDGFEPADFLSAEDLADGRTESDCWPYILIVPTMGEFDESLSLSPIQSDEYRVVAFDREDHAQAAGSYFENRAEAGLKAILAALTGFDLGFSPISPIVETPSGERGTVAECTLLPAKWRRCDGERGRRVCERGASFRVTSS